MIKVMRFKQGRGYISKVRENQGSTEPFKMEYRLFTIVRYTIGITTLTVLVIVSLTKTKLTSLPIPIY